MKVHNFVAILVLVAVLANATSGHSQEGTTSEGGKQQKTRYYKPELMGPPPANGPVVVQAAFFLDDIDDIDDETETFEFTGVLVTKWHDPRQAFDPKQVGTAEMIFQGDFQFNELAPAWYPQIVLVNESGAYEKHAVLLRVAPDGSSTLVEKIIAVAEADLDLRRFPFDRQQLEATFEILGFDQSEVIFDVRPDPAEMEKAQIEIPQWTLKRVAASTREYSASHAGPLGTTSTFVLTMDLQRQSLFMIRLVVLPLIMIVILSWSVFWMDRSSLGDRISVSFIGILTSVTYQVVVSGILPEISYTTWMNGFLNISFLIMSATVVINLVVGAADQQGLTARGDLIDRRCRWIFPLVYFGMLTITLLFVHVWF